MKLIKQGFSLVEVMLILLAVSVVIAASISLITRNSVPITEGTRHGTFRCIGVPGNVINSSNEISQELKNAYNNEGRNVYLVETYNSKNSTPISSKYSLECKFNPPKDAPLFRVDLYGAGGGGYDYFAIETNSVQKENEIDLKKSITDGYNISDSDYKYNNNHILDVTETDINKILIKKRNVSEYEEEIQHPTKSIPATIVDLFTGNGAYLTYYAAFGRGGEGATVNIEKELVDFTSSQCKCVYGYGENDRSNEITSQNINEYRVRSEYHTYIEYINAKNQFEEDPENSGKNFSSSYNTELNSFNACESGNGAQYGYIWVCPYYSNAVFKGGKGGTFNTESNKYDPYYLAAYYPLQKVDFGISASSNNVPGNPVNKFIENLQNSNWKSIQWNNDKFNGIEDNDNSDYQASVDAWGIPGGDTYEITHNDSSIANKFKLENFNSNYANNTLSESFWNNPLSIIDGLVMEARHSRDSWNAGRISLPDIQISSNNTSTNNTDFRNYVLNIISNKFYKYEITNSNKSLVDKIKSGIGGSNNYLKKATEYSSYGKWGAVPKIRVGNSNKFYYGLEDNNSSANSFCAASGGGPTSLTLGIKLKFTPENAANLAAANESTDFSTINSILDNARAYLKAPKDNEDNPTTYDDQSGENGHGPVFLRNKNSYLQYNSASTDSGHNLCKQANIKGINYDEISTDEFEFENVHTTINPLKNMGQKAFNDLKNASDNTGKEQVFIKYHLPYEKIVGGVYGNLPDSDALNNELPEMNIKFTSKPTYLVFKLGNRGGNGEHVSYTKTYLGDSCTVTMSGGGGVREQDNSEQEIDNTVITCTGSGFQGSARSAVTETDDIQTFDGGYQRFGKSMISLAKNDGYKEQIKNAIGKTDVGPYKSTVSAMFKDLIEFLKGKSFANKTWANNENIGRGGEGTTVYDNCFDLYGTMDISVTVGNYSNYTGQDQGNYDFSFYRQSRDRCVERTVELLGSNASAEEFYTNITDENNDWFLSQHNENTHVKEYFRKVKATAGYGGAVMISW